MKTSANRTQDNESRAVANNVSCKREERQAVQFVDNSPHTKSIAQLQEMANRSVNPHCVQLRKFQEMADRSVNPHDVQMRKLFAIINNSPQRKTPVLPGVTQKKGPLDEEELQFKSKEAVQKKGPLDEEELQFKKDAAVQCKGPLDEEELQFKSKEAVQCKGPLDEEELQFKAEEPVQKQENKTGLPDDLKAGVENLSGMAMDDVRVHYNSGKPAQLNAYAYTQGTEIHIAPGQEKHLPHEAWHVVQQAQGRVQPTMQMKDGISVNDDTGLEHEADVMGAQAAQMKSDMNDVGQDCSPNLVQHLQLRNSLYDNGGTIQPKWVIAKEGFRWDQLIDGVQWYSDEDGMMFYTIADEKQIKLGNIKDYIEQQNVKKPHEFWLSQSVAGYDIIGTLDSSVVNEGNINRGVLKTDSLKIFTTASQFKDIYVCDDKLLSVFKTCDSSSVLSEVATLHKIASAGFLTPNAIVVDVIHKRKKTLGIVMDKVKGVFVDLAKVENTEAIYRVLNEAAAGKEASTSEMGLIKLLSSPKSEPIPQVLQALVQDLERILASKKEIVINDLQFIVRPDGRVVIIDPQWAGGCNTLTNLGEIQFIMSTYKRLEIVIGQLKGVKQTPMKSHVDRFNSQHGLGPGFGPPKGGGGGFDKFFQ